MTSVQSADTTQSIGKYPLIFLPNFPFFSPKAKPLSLAGIISFTILPETMRNIVLYSRIMNYNSQFDNRKEYTIDYYT